MFFSEIFPPRVLGDIKSIPDDTELLRRYAADHSEAAFGELVQRHFDLVYSAALRQVGSDTHRAEDVTQMVFTDLARKAHALRSHPALAGWLYTSAHFAATKLIRSEVRRQAREREAHAMHQLDTPVVPENTWARIRPILDEVMHELDERQRVALVLRFFDQRSMTEVAERLSLTESAARKRIDRTLEELRELLAKRGIDSTGTALASILVTQTVIAAPAGLAFAVSSAALAGLKGGVGSSVLVHLLTGSKLKLGLAAGLAAIGLGYLAQKSSNDTLQTVVTDLQRQYQAKLRQNMNLQQQGQQLRSDLRGQQDAVARLRDELAVLQNRPPSPAAGAIAVNDWHDVGQSTPENAWLTAMWALHAGRIDAIEKVMRFDPNDRAIADLSFAGLPKNIQVEYGTSDKLAAVLWANSSTARTDFRWARINHRLIPEKPDDVTLEAVEQLKDDETRTAVWRFLRGTDGNWRGVYSANIIEVWGIQYDGVFPSKTLSAADIIRQKTAR